MESSEVPLGYSLVGLCQLKCCCFGSVGLYSSYVPNVHRCGVGRLGQKYSPGNWVVKPASFPS